MEDEAAETRLAPKPMHRNPFILALLEKKTTPLGRQPVAPTTRPERHHYDSTQVFALSDAYALPYDDGVGVANRSHGLDAPCGVPSVAGADAQYTCGLIISVLPNNSLD